MKMIAGDIQMVKQHGGESEVGLSLQAGSLSSGISTGIPVNPFQVLNTLAIFCGARSEG